MGADSGTPSTVTMNINAEGEIIVAGKQFTLNRTSQIIRDKLNQTGNPNDVKIEIRCDKRCPAEFVNKVVEQLAELGFQYVKIAVSSER